MKYQTDVTIGGKNMSVILWITRSPISLHRFGISFILHIINSKRYRFAISYPTLGTLGINDMPKKGTFQCSLLGSLIRAKHASFGGMHGQEYIISVYLVVLLGQTITAVRAVRNKSCRLSASIHSASKTKSLKTLVKQNAFMIWLSDIMG